MLLDQRRININKDNIVNKTETFSLDADSYTHQAEVLLIGKLGASLIYCMSC